MLESRNISFSYDEEMQFRFPELKCQSGDHWLIIGPSGCGKTTWMHILGGLLTPQEGEVLIGDTSLYSLAGAQRDRFRGQHIGIVFQRTHLIRSLSVMQNLQLTAKLAGRKVDKATIQDLLERLKIDQRAKAKPEELSQGELQRAGIARALVTQPQWILADEPTASLDDDNCESVMTLLEEAAATYNAGLIVVTHDNRLKDRFTNTIAL